MKIQFHLRLFVVTAFFILFIMPVKASSITVAFNTNGPIIIDVEFISGNNKKGSLIISEEALIFKRRNKEQNIVALNDIIGYQIQGENSFAILSSDGSQFAFKVDDVDDALSSIERNRRLCVESRGISEQELNIVGEYHLVDGYALIDGEIVPNLGTSPDIIVTATMDVIESTVFVVNEKEVLYKNYPLDKESPLLSLPISSLMVINLREGKDIDYSQQFAQSLDEAENNTDILGTKGLWIVNADNQKLTYETVARYLDEKGIDQYSHLRHKGNAGKVLMSIGGGFLIFDAVLYEFNLVDYIVDNAFRRNDYSLLIGYGVTLVGGLVLSIVGGVIRLNAQRDLDSFVAEWNAQQKITITKGLSFGKTYSGYGVAFTF